MRRAVLMVVLVAGCAVVPGEEVPDTAAAVRVAVDALDEVNAARARRRLPPFQRDDLLSEGARRAAAYRAQHGIKGHTKNDFTFLPEGAKADATGCAAWPAEMGWGACCSWERYRYAGAAYAVGAGGVRFMHLFVRR